jgi:hypothetical protein
MVSGDMSISVARMTGKVRVAGDGHFGIIFNGFVGAMQNAQAAPGVRGWITRAAVRRALRKGGYTPRTERGAKKDE